MAYANYSAKAFIGNLIGCVLTLDKLHRSTWRFWLDGIFRHIAFDTGHQLLVDAPPISGA